MSESRPAAPFGARFLRLFGDVASSEVRGVLLMFTTIFTLLVAYYLLKTVREPLVLATGGAELKTYASAAQAMVLLLYVPFYGRLAASLPVQRLVTRVNRGHARVPEECRCGSTIAAGVVFIGTRVVGLSASMFAATNVVLVPAAQGVTWLLLREYHRLIGALAPARAAAAPGRLAEAHS